MLMTHTELENLVTLHRDRLQGGRADHANLADFDPIALNQGIEHEMEHTSDVNIAAEIAADHLAEDPKYYTKLKKMEAKNESKQKVTKKNKKSLIEMVNEVLQM